MTAKGMALSNSANASEERLFRSAAKSSQTPVNKSDLKKSDSHLISSSGISANASRILNLQRTVGNQTVLRMLSSPASSANMNNAITPAPVLAPAAEDDKKEESVSKQPEETPTTKAAAEPEQNTDPDEAVGMSVKEEFQPQEYDEVPDEHTHLASADSGVETPQKDEGVETPHKADEEPEAPDLSFTNLGCVGTVPYDSAQIDKDDQRPHAFTNGGQTATIVWAGGGGAGAHGNQGAGTVQSQVAPTYESRSNKDSKDADAWVKAGTGKVDVTRSYLGAFAGDQGNGHFVTANAAARLNLHETLHVNNSQANYNTHIKPMLDRVADRSLGLNVAATEAAAISALRALIKYPEAITAFQAADLAANKPMGTIDTNDKASGTYPVDAGPGTVAGKAYQHRVRTPAEPNPAP